MVTSPNKALEATGHSVGPVLIHESVECGPRLSFGVDMTSNVKSGEQTFLGLHEVFLPSYIRRAGASNMRRLILLISVGWRPPYLRPSGAGLTLGSSMP
jgi:hypothetical protein